MYIITGKIACHWLSLRKVVGIHNIQTIIRVIISLHSRESSRGVALIRLDNHTASKLLVGIGRPDNLASLIDNGESSEAILLAELAAPAGGDGIFAAGGGATVGPGGRGTLHDVGAGSGITGAGVDAKSPGAGGVFGVADTLGVLESPLGGVGHHGLGRGVGGGSEGRGGKEAGSEEELSELHDNGWNVEFLIGLFSLDGCW